MANNGRTTLYYIFQKKKLASGSATNGYKYDFEEVSRDTRLVGELSIHQMLDDVPTVSMAIPIDALPKNDSGLPVTNLNNYRVLLSIMEKGTRKYGLACIVESIQIDYATGVVQLALVHRMAEMKQWVLPANLVVKEMPLGHCVENVAKLGFPDDYVRDEQVLQSINYITNKYVAPEAESYPVLPTGTATRHVQSTYNSLSEAEKLYVPAELPVTIEMDAYAYNTLLEMTFSSTNKLEALAEIMKNTKDLHFLGTISGHEMFYEPTNGSFGDGVKISNFDDECDYSIIVTQNNLNPAIDDCDENGSDVSTIAMLSDPVCSQDLTDHFNRAVVFCGDVGDGILHMTLKDIYTHPELQDPDFPVEAYTNNINLQPEAEYNENGTKINNEKIYQKLEIPVIANNDNREYYVTDVKQVAEDNGVIYHTVYNFSDLFPIPDTEYTDEKGNKIELEITDDDRLEITKRAYNRAIRYLKAQRPEWKWQFNTEALPAIDMVGKRVRFRYQKRVTKLNDCNEPEETVVAAVDECFYITERTITFDAELNETATITLDTELRPNTNAELTYELTHPKGGDETTATTWGTLYPEFGDSSWNSDTQVIRTPQEVAKSTPTATILAPDTGMPPSN